MKEDIISSLYKFTEIVSNNSVKKSDATLTIECKILEIVDELAGIYRVEYFNNSFSAHSANSNTTYSIGEMVYIIVPNGDFEKKKVIIGSIEPTIDIQKKELNNDDKYYNISHNLININNETIYELNSYNSTYSKFTDIINISNEISNYSKDNKIFSLECSIKTNLPSEQQVKGNYGVILNIPIKYNNDISIRTITIDVDNMSGSPYNFNDWSKQKVYFTIDKKYDIIEKDIEITIFSDNNFNQNIDNIKEDIWIKDISLYAVENKSINNENGYLLSIKPSFGIYFSDKHNNNRKEIKTLTATLELNGKRIDSNNIDFYWFIEDMSIKPNSDNYVKCGGRGYKCLNSKQNIYDKVSTYITNESIIKDIDIATNYKCVAIYKNQSISAMIELKDLNVNQSLSIVGETVYPENMGDVILTSIVDYQGNIIEKNKELFKYYWVRFDKNGNYIDDDFYEYNSYNVIEDKKLYSEIKFKTYKVDTFNTLKCTCYFRDKVIGTKSIIISTNKDFTYITNIIGNNKVFQYNENGSYNKDYKNIETLDFEVYRNNNVKIDKSNIKNAYWKISKNSLLKVNNNTIRFDDNYNYYNAKDILNYTVLPQYNYNKANSISIVLEIEIDDSTKLSYPANISFTKIGNNGTNGTNYSIQLKQDKLSLMYIQSLNNYTNLSNINVRDYFDFYKDGEIYSDKYTIEYSIFDEYELNKKQLTCITIDKNTGKLGRLNNSLLNIDKKYINIIQIKIICNSIVNYAYLPIELTIANEEFVYNTIPSIQGGFTEVQYNSDGSHPTYDNSTPFSFNNKYLKVDWSCGDNCKGTISKNDYIVKPIDKYNNGNTNNYVSAKCYSIQNTENLKEYYDNVDKIEKLNKKIEISQLKNDNFKKNIKLLKIEDWKVNLYKSEELFKLNSKLIDSKNEIINEINNIKLEYNSIPKDIVTLLDKTIEQVKLLEDIECIESKLNYILILNTYIQKYKSISKLLYSDKYSELREINDKVVKEFNNFIYYKDNREYEEKYSNIISVIYKESFNIINNDIEIVNIKIEALNKIIDNYFKNIIDYDKNKNEYIIKDNALISISELQQELDNLKQLNDDIFKQAFNQHNTYRVTLPIAFYYNRYGYENFNVWDGNKLTIDNDGGYILAPQLGAGVKNNDNTFTGITIGTEVSKDTKDKIGLLAYSKGVRSIFLNAEDGSATFGTSTANGQIKIDPDKATIGSNSLEIGLGKDTNTYIKFKNGKFEVTHEGKLTSTSGAIGGWSIGDTTLKSKTLTFDAANSKIYSNTHSSLSSQDNGFYLSNDGLSIGSKLKVTNTGSATLSEATVSGSITATKLIANVEGSIGGWTINSNSLKAKSGKMYLNSDSSIGGEKWSITSAGVATFQDIRITGGSISNTITNNGTIKGGIIQNGAISGSTGSNFTMSSGSIGGNTVSNSGLSYTKGGITGNTTIGLGDTGLNKNGIDWNGSKLSISGDIYANNLHLSDTAFAAGVDIRSTNGSYITVQNEPPATSPEEAVENGVLVSNLISKGPIRGTYFCTMRGNVRTWGVTRTVTIDDNKKLRFQNGLFVGEGDWLD